jgi:hypothetical protein
MNQRNSPKFAIWLIEKLGFLRHKSGAPRRSPRGVPQRRPVERLVLAPDGSSVSRHCSIVCSGGCSPRSGWARWMPRHWSPAFWGQPSSSYSSKEEAAWRARCVDGTRPVCICRALELHGVSEQNVAARAGLAWILCRSLSPSASHPCSQQCSERLTGCGKKPAWQHNLLVYCQGIKWTE